MQPQIFQTEYNKLNQNQKKAVDTIYGPVMVVAGPGTGKTQIIWLRTANIIQKAQVNPGNILITTFTDAGVVAIKKRLESFLWSDGYKVVVSTIHGFCQDVIRNFPEKFLEFKAGTPIDDIDSLEILKQIIDTEVWNKNIEVLTNEYDRYIYLRDIKSRIWVLKQEAITFIEFENIIQNQEQIYTEELAQIKPTLKKYEKTKLDQEKHIKKLQELNYLYSLYQKTLHEISKYDFNDMIHFVVDIFEKDEEMKYFYAEKFQFIMLDEFQDTNNAQNKIIDLILSVGSEKPNILVVWDDDQSIYRFQWANIENMLDFSSKYSDLEIVVLENNYRSNQPILDLCTHLIDNNNERLSKRIPSLEKKLISSNPKLNMLENKPTLYTPNTQEEEKAYLLHEIKNKINEWIALEEIAIIMRNNKEVEELSIYFEQNNIWVTSKLNTDILKNKYVEFLIKYLHCLENPGQNDDFFIDIVRSSIVWLSQVDIFKFNKYLYNVNYSKKFKLSFFDVFCEIEKTEIEINNKQSLIDFRDDFLDILQKLHDLNFVEFFSYFIDKIWIISYIEKYGNFDDIEDIFTLFNKIKSFTQIKSTFKLSDFLSKIDLYKEYNYSIPRQILKKSQSWIHILTAHGSKWLEYEIVFIPSLFTGNWDNKRVIDKLKLPNGIAGAWLQIEVDPIEEERRLFFVACSRAKKELFLSFPLSIDKKIKLASVFITEIEWYYEWSNSLKNFSSAFETALQTAVKNQLTNHIISYSQSEFDYIKEFIESYKLSPTDLNVFLEDPLIFLQNVVFKYPFVDNDATIFWKVYHRVLELFYSRYKENKKLDDVGYLTFTFKVLLQKEVLTPESFERLLEKWTKWLEWFYSAYKNNKREVLYLEYNLRPKWISYKWVPITGKIDKIERIWLTDSQNKNQIWQLAFFRDIVAIIDYKTGRPKSIWEIKWIDKDGNKKQWAWKYFRQLMFYKLLCESDTDFDSKFEIWALALDFVEWRNGEYKYIEVSYSSEEYEDFKSEIIEARKKISSIDFWKEVLWK